LLDRALRRAHWTILWERLWPALASIVTAVGLFLAISWLGLWLWLPPLGRAIGLSIFFLILAAAFAPLFLVRIPTRNEALRRLDRNTGRPHRPATTMSDRIASGVEDTHASTLWRAHVERALRAAATLRAGVPMPRLAARDPVALRAFVLVLVIATFVAAGGDRVRRITTAFDWQGVIAPANYRIDAWVSPPTYTGKPPIILQGLRPGEPAPSASAAIAVPVGSTLVVRATGLSKLDVSVSGGMEETEAQVQPASARGTEERRFTVGNTGAVTLRTSAAGDVTWSFTAIPDLPPKIALAKDPEAQLRGALQLSYKLEDDYGVVGAQATFQMAKKQGAAGLSPRSLYEAPEMTLVLPQARTRSGVGQTTRDLTEHPWAGTEVIMTLVARDEAGNEGQSDPFELRLPERVFTKPIARALIEQRRNLALDVDAQADVLNALDALTWEPERFKIETNVYLGLRSIFSQLARAKTDEHLRDVVDRMWEMAVFLEDGNISDAEQALRAAEEALRQALERGATDEEIKKLMDQLRAALDKFLQALAEQLKRNPDQMARPLDPNARQLSPQDLKNMLNRMEQMARSGARDAARKLLDELSNLLNNLQMARPGQQGGDDDDDSNALDQLGDIIREQQQLRDRTFQQGQDQRRQKGQKGQKGQQGKQGKQGEQGGDQGDDMAGLQKQQQALRDQLSKLLEELKKRGMGQPGGKGQEGEGGDLDQLGSAGDAMGDAEGELGQGDADGAVDSQGRALEALRRGAQNLAQSMQQQQGMGPGMGRPGRLGPPRAQQKTDPLGRPLRGRDYGDDVTVKVPGEIDTQRARRILEELRRRFGESFRPQLELEYIERLLRGFQ
jgi:uncharacterized protein (TIGR02302 family)